MRQQSRKSKSVGVLLVITMVFCPAGVVTPSYAQNKVVVIPLIDTVCAGPPAPVPKTGQTASYQTGDDGDLEKGVAWPAPRLRDNGNGTVTDNLTRLVWLKNANCFSVLRTFSIAVNDCNGLATGHCSLTDGSQAGDWRLPNLRELHSLVDYTRSNPCLPTGHPFMDVLSDNYWSSTTHTGYNAAYAWYVVFSTGGLSSGQKIYGGYVWCVRDPQ